MNSKIYDQWLKINVILNKKLEELNMLEKEKKAIIDSFDDEANKDEMFSKMNASVTKYENLLKDINKLKGYAKDLEKKINVEN